MEHEHTIASKAKATSRHDGESPSHLDMSEMGSQYERFLSGSVNHYEKNKASTRNRFDDEEEEDEDGDSIDAKVPPHTLFFILKWFLTSLFPNWTPVLMCGTVIVVSTFLCFFRASEGGTPQLFFFTLYVIISISLWIFFLLCRLLVVNILGANGSVRESKLYNILISILNPEGVYLACTIFSTFFWSRAVIPVNDVIRASDVVNFSNSTIRPLVNYRFLGISMFTAPTSPVDLEILQKTQFFLIIWSSRDVVMNIALFLFLLGFMKNVNKNLVEFLSLYSLVRKLNSNWIKLAPIITKLSRSSPDDLPPKDSMTEFSLTGIEEKGLGRSLRGNYGSGDDMSLSYASNSKVRHLPGHQEEPSFIYSSDSKSYKKPYLRQVSRPAAQVVDELLYVEARSKQRKKPKPSMTKASPSNTPLSRLKTTAPLEAKQKKQRLMDGYDVEWDGMEIPPELWRENIEETEKNGLANFLSVNYVHNHNVALFVRGVRVELYSKHLARLVGCRLFEELMEFRDEVAPEEDLSAEQLDTFVKNKVLATIELVHLHDASSQSFTKSPTTKRGKSAKRFFALKRFFTKKPSESKLDTVEDRYDEKDQKFYSITVPRKHMENSPYVKSQPGLPLPPRKTQDTRQYLSPPPQEAEENNAVPPLKQHPQLRRSIDGPAISLLRVEPSSLVPSLPANNDRQFLTLELFRIFLGDEVHDFMKYADPGGRDRVSIKQFSRIIIDLYQMRKQLVALVDSQKGIQNVFQRMMSIFLGFICFLIFLVVAGVSATTIVISGAASISSITVSLSFLYSGFIQSVMFVCFLNPYNVGDRVRLNDELLVVKRVSTYFSEFASVPYNKPSFWNHSLLYNTIIVNESRCRNAGLEIPLLIAYDTEPSLYDELRNYIENYVNTNPELVKGSLFLLLNELVLGDYIKCTYWITCTESWHHWKAVYSTRTRLLLAIAHKCQLLGITYRLPTQPIKLKNTEASHAVDLLLKTTSQVKSEVPRVPHSPFRERYHAIM